MIKYALETIGMLSMFDLPLAPDRPYILVNLHKDYLDLFLTIDSIALLVCLL